jgi:hypothetical protein
MRTAALGLDLLLVGIDLGDQPYDYAKAIGHAPQDYRSALLVVSSPAVFRDRQRLAEFALTHRIATMLAWREHVDVGGLMSYGASVTLLYKRAAEIRSNRTRDNAGGATHRTADQVRVARQSQDRQDAWIDNTGILPRPRRRGDRMSAFTSEIGTFETCRRTARMSVYWGRPEVSRTRSKRRD